ncbi:TraE/TraK family type IV conjugative transfer system protein [Alkanindiges hydrocarboniclasticus]
MRLEWLKANKIAVSSMALNMILGASVLTLSYGISTKHERLVIMPPIVNNAFEVQWNGASSTYYQDMSIFVASMMGSTTKANINYNLEAISKFASPPMFKVISERLRGYVSTLPVDVTLAAWFTPIDVRYEPATNKVFVIGSLNSSAVANQANSKDVIYEFQWQIIAGRPEFQAFDSYEGTEPHTQMWLKNNPNPQQSAPATTGTQAQGQTTSPEVSANAQ